MRRILSGALVAGLLAVVPGRASDEPRVVPAAVGAPVRVSAAALLVSGMTGGRFEVAVTSVVLPSTEESTARRVLLTVDVGTPVLAELPEPWDLEVVSYAMTPDEAVVATSSLALEVERGTAFSGLQVLDDLMLEPGDYVVRVLVRERASGELGLVSTELEVPRRAAAGGPEALWMLRPAADWILGLATPEAGGLDPRAVELAVVGSEPATELIPAPFGTLVPGAPGRALLLVPAARADGEATARLRDAFGVEVATVTATLAPPARGGLPAPTLMATFTVPALATGVYSASFVVGGDETRRLAFAVASASGDAAGRESAVGGAELAGPTRSVREAIARYEEALALLAGGDEEAARAALRGLDQAMLAGGRAGAGQRLLRAQQNVVSRLAGEAPAGLTAVLDLHVALLDEYGASGEATLESHTMQILLRLAGALERRAEPADRVRAATALARAGASLERAHWLLQADKVLAQAIDFDGGCRDALLAAAALREKSEEPAEAVGLLEALVEHHPGDEEGRLRLALNLARVNRTPRAVELLRALAPEAETRWISVVAYQELARLESATDQEAARASLAAALARWPDEQGLTLQLLVLHDRRWPGDRAAVPSALVRAEHAHPAPRALYNRWPRLESDAADDEAGREALARWLGERRP